MLITVTPKSIPVPPKSVAISFENLCDFVSGITPWYERGVTRVMGKDGRLVISQTTYGSADGTSLVRIDHGMMRAVLSVMGNAAFKGIHELNTKLTQSEIEQLIVLLSGQKQSVSERAYSSRQAFRALIEANESKDRAKTRKSAAKPKTKSQRTPTQKTASALRRGTPKHSAKKIANTKGA